ncbi:MAG: PQQ-dependent sugar dehydrogenase [Limisphaerales bacterium]
MTSNRPLRAALLAAVLAVPAALTAAPALKPFAGGFVQPLTLVPLDARRLLVADQTGVVQVVGGGGETAATPFLDLRSKLVKLNAGFDERGLLGLALHPKFAENRKFYVFYSAPLGDADLKAKEWDHTDLLSEFTASADATTDLATERVLLQIHQPHMNHNSGRLVFGPDGFLYVSIGDGGNANGTGRGHDPQGNSQILTTLLGKMLRLDVDRQAGGKPYAVPSDNPFVGRKDALPEIFATGLRNPWGMSFGPAPGHALILADVGQTMWEEINVIAKGGNYGWPIREGTAGFDKEDPKRMPTDRPRTGLLGEPLLDPALEYKNVNGWPGDKEAAGISITGGHVYRGQALPELRGKYVFADWSKNWSVPDGRLYVATMNEGKWSMEPLALPMNPAGKVPAYVCGLGEDADGELYVLSNRSNGLVGTNGRVWKLVAAQ